MDSAIPSCDSKTTKTQRGKPDKSVIINFYEESRANLGRILRGVDDIDAVEVHEKMELLRSAMVGFIDIPQEARCSIVDCDSDSSR